MANKTSEPLLETPDNAQMPPVPELTPEQKQLLNEFRASQPWRNVPLSATTTSGTATGEESVQIDPQQQPQHQHQQQHARSASFEALESAVHANDELGDEYWLEHFCQFCSDACLLRYLRAHNWHLANATLGLISTLHWRRRFRPHLIATDDPNIIQHARMGKTYLNGFSIQGHPILYFRSHRNTLVTTNSTPHDYAHDIRFLVFNLESAIQLMPPTQEKVILIFDFSHYSSSTSVPMHVSRYFLHLFASHYPERLARVFACDAPWYFWMFYKLVSPFIHPVTKSKIRFVQVAKQAQVKSDDETWANILHTVDERVLESDFGGARQFDYDFEAYWPVLVSRLNPHPA